MKLLTKKKVVFSLLAFMMLVFGMKASIAVEKGRLVVCLASKGEMFDERSSDAEGVAGLGELAHKYGFPVTYYLKSFTASRAQDILRQGHAEFGDEVGWYAEGTALADAEEELAELQALVPWMKIRTVAQLHYGRDWVDFFSANGVESVWGRCYEQTATDGITDRGCPFGFYYLDPECFKVPNRGKKGVVSVPWLSNDVNLVYHTAQQSTFTFDVNDPQDIGVFAGNLCDESFWEAELAEYEKQTTYNKLVPLVLQQEIGEFIFSGVNEWRLSMKKDARVILETLFRVLKRRGIEVVTVSEAVDLYKKTYPESTPPTYAVFDNVARKLPALQRLETLVPVDERFSLEKEKTYGSYGPHFNGYYATGRIGREWFYYSPEKSRLSDFPGTLTYYDVNGLLVFEAGSYVPSRITPYGNLPSDAHVTAILPELSRWFDTQQYIPCPDVQVTQKGERLNIRIEVEYLGDPILNLTGLPYGIMLWGNSYDRCKIASNMPSGTKKLSGAGLFIPLVLERGNNVFHYELKMHRDL